MGKVILTVAAELGSTTRRVPSGAPKFPRRRGGGERGTDWQGVAAARRGETSGKPVMSRQRGAHTGAIPEPRAPSARLRAALPGAGRRWCEQGSRNPRPGEVLPAAAWKKRGYLPEEAAAPTFGG